MRGVLVLLLLASPLSAAAQLDGGARRDAGRAARLDATVSVRPDAGARARADAGAADGGRRWRPRTDGGLRPRRPIDAGLDAGALDAVLDAGVGREAPPLDAGVPPPMDAGALETAALDAGVLAAAPRDDGGLEGGASWLDGGELDAAPIEAADGQVLGDAALASAPAPGAPDAGPTVVVVTVPSDRSDRDFLGALGELFYEREAREAREQERRSHEAEPARDGGPSTVTLAPIFGGRSFWESIGLDLPEGRIATFGLLVLLLVALGAHWLLARLRRPLPRRGLAPRVLSVLLALARLAVVLLLLMLVARLLPDWMRPAVLLALAAASVAAGWAAWVIVPDLIAALVIVTERRVRVGDWLEADRFAGVVEQIGARTTLLRAEDGAELVVPNRLLVRSALVSRDRRFHEVVARLRAPSGAPAPRLRSAIRDAVLCSAYVPAHPRLRIERDPLEPDVWRIRVRLLDAKLAGTFEGELRERVEEVLALEEDA